LEDPIGTKIFRIRVPGAHHALPGVFLLFVAGLLASTGCSLNKLAVDTVVDFFAEGDSAVFTGEEDPELLGEALPFALKLYESLLSSAPENENLLLTTGQGFILYANAYVQSPAQMLPDEYLDEKLKELERAKKLYLRGRGYIFRALELRNAGFGEYLTGDNWKDTLALTTEEDVPFLYWCALSWLGALSTDLFDMELLISVPRAVALAERILELDESYAEGGVHELFLTYYGSLPAEMGGDHDRARDHYRRALELSQGKKASPYVTLATSVVVAEQDLEEFRELLNKALAIDLEVAPELRLMNLMAQNRALWLLEHEEDYFLLEDVF
jgi:predicted anti-sigma-YlaC factor YlaD